MSRRALLGFLFLNVLVTFATVFVVIKVYSGLAPEGTPRPTAPPLVVLITNTPDPRGTQIAYIVVTATPQSGAPSASDQSGTPGDTGSNGTDVAATAAPVPSSGGGDNSPIPTLDPSLLPANLGTIPAPGNPGAASNDLTGTPNPAANCQTYALKQGDTAGKVAQVYGVALNDLMRANKLKDADLARLQIGQVLIIPINGCGLATDAPTETDTPTRVVLPTFPPTSTLAPTAAQAQIEVVQVISPGDITSEGVEIRNVSGGVIPMKNWTVSDGNGLKFTFPDYRMFPGGRVTIYSKSGTDTPIVLYWGQSKAVWGDPGAQVTVSDAQGVIQASYPVSNGPLAPPSTGNGVVPTPTSGA